MAAPPAWAGWTRVGELASAPGDLTARGLVATDPSGIVMVEAIASASTIRVRVGTLNGATLTPLGPDPVASGPVADAQASVRAVVVPGTVIVAVPIKDSDGTHERLEVVSVSGGKTTDLGRIEPVNTEYSVEPTSVSISSAGDVVVAYRAATTDGGAVHARVATRSTDGTWHRLYTGTFFPSGPSTPTTPADRVVAAYDGTTLEAASGSSSTPVVIERLDSGTSWIEQSSFGLPPLQPSTILVGGGVTRVVASGGSLLVDARLQGTTLSARQSLPSMGSAGALVGANGTPDAACGLLTGQNPAATSAQAAVSCLDPARGLWQLVGPTVVTGSTALGGIGASVSPTGAFAVITAPDAAGPHAQVYRLDADMSATAAVTGSAAATLIASVGTYGRATSAHFQYGTTTTYGKQTPAVNLPGVSSPVPLTANLTGLQPSTTYHYSVVTDNGAGPVASGDQTFDTLKDSRGPQVVFTIPGRVRLGRSFTLRVRADEGGLFRLELVNITLRPLRTWNVRLPLTPSPTGQPHALLLRRLVRPKLPPGRYLWLATATDTHRNTSRFAPRSVLVVS
jgi:hypothetical protein